MRLFAIEAKVIKKIKKYDDDQEMDCCLKSTKQKKKLED